MVAIAMRVRSALLSMFAGVSLVNSGCPRHAVQPPVVVPFELVRGVPVVRATMNEAGPYNFILDTGANPSAVDIETARTARIFLDTTRSGEAEGAGADRVRIFAARIDRLAIGALRADSIEAVAVDLSGIADRLGIPLHGVLGYSLLAGRVLRIEYGRSTISFLPSSEPTPPAELDASGDRMTVPLEFPPGETIPLIRAFQVNGQTLPVTLDTGSSVTLELSPADASALGVRQPAVPQDTGAAVGARGVVALGPGEADWLGIGSLRMDHATVQISPRLSESPYRHGNLGNGFLQHFVVTLNYAHRQVTLQSGIR